MTTEESRNLQRPEPEPQRGSWIMLAIGIVLFFWLVVSGVIFYFYKY